MAVTLADIKKLRDITGAGMMDVKKALEEANGDFEVAKDFCCASVVRLLLPSVATVRLPRAAFWQRHRVASALL